MRHNILGTAFFLRVLCLKLGIKFPNLAPRAGCLLGVESSQRVWRSIGVTCVASVSSRVIAWKLEREQKKNGRGKGRGEEETLVSRRTRAETLAMQATIGEERSRFVEPTIFSQKIQIHEVSLKNSGNYSLRDCAIIIRRGGGGGA